MKASLSWLSDHVEVTLPADELAERLTRAGLEVSSVEHVGGDWNQIVVAHVVAVDAHPNADRLKLATVDTGTHQITVVCGAPNIRPDQKVAFAPVGARLVDSHTGKMTTLKPAKIRGVLSEGMVCSEKELGISDDHEGIMVLPKNAPVGLPLEQYLSDSILDLEVTPNRPDCLSIVGIAHEVAALTDSDTKPVAMEYEQEQPPVEGRITVEIEDPLLCARYCAGLVSGVRIGPSPGWLQRRLVSHGMRPINNVVDITNYVMLEYGQPLHAFDYDKIRGKGIIVRRGKQGEVVRTIDGVERAVDDSVLVIADKEQAVAVAGIMGGEDTEVTQETKTILLEAANFNQGCIRRGSQWLGLKSEASIRFEKSLNPELAVVGCRRAMQLLVEVAEGKAAEGIVDAYPGQVEPARILLSEERVRQLSGLDIDAQAIRRVLESLGFECTETESPTQLSIATPYWRSDVDCSADLVEEVARIVGYDKVPFKPLTAALPQQRPTPLIEFRERLRTMMVGGGLQEVLTYPLTSLDKLQKLSATPRTDIGALKVANPMSREQEYLRTNLRANLLSTAASNQRRRDVEHIRLFEIGKVFLPKGEDLPEEREMLCAILGGSRTPLSWHGDSRPVDFYDAKGMTESILDLLGLEGRFEECGDTTLSPGRAAAVSVRGEVIGVVGEVDPRVAEHFDLTGAMCLVELDVGKLLDKSSGEKRYQPVSRFPSVTRDVALVVDESTPYQHLADIIHSFPLVSKVVPFDVYRGKQVPQGKKSFAIRVLYRSPTHTLTDKEVDEVQAQMIHKLQFECGATLRA
jgi:phenylalanyl-tRNA synthetase beta chain